METPSTCWSRQHVAFVERASQLCYFPTLPQVSTKFGVKMAELANEDTLLVSFYPVVAAFSPPNMMVSSFMMVSANCCGGNERYRLAVMARCISRWWRRVVNCAPGSSLSELELELELE